MSDSDIVTRCPQCNTAFRVTPNQLSVAGGVVRCGSCLAVFKAADHETLKDNNKTSNSQPNTDTSSPKESPFSPEETIEDELELEFEFEDEDGNELIEDEIEETIISSDEAIYDLETDEKGSKTSLFERQLKPVSQQSKESADESWALDMLADLKDDEIKPFNFTRKKKKEDKQPIPEKDQDPVEDIPLSPLAANEVLETEPTEIDIQASESEPPPISESDEENHSLHLQASDTDHEDLDDIESLFFDEDGVTETIDLDQEAPPPVDSNIGTHRDITDEEIENAMNIRTHYAGEELFLQNIEPPPVEMEWYEYDHTKRWLWVIGAIFALFILVIQLFIFRFDTLSKHPTYRPFYKQVCVVFGCQLPGLIDVDKIRTTNLIVRSHPNREKALIVDAILINTAAFNQNYPVLRLEFSDINNTILASRSLDPHDYLQGELAGAREMPINQPVQISLEIVDPGEAAVNYQLSVLKAAKF
jgi:predicted Zn finger-like uncharacterized protein